MRREFTTRDIAMIGATVLGVSTSFTSVIMQVPNTLWLNMVLAVPALVMVGIVAHKRITGNPPEKIVYTLEFDLPRIAVAERGTGFAAWMAGKRRNVGSAWLDDLRGDPESKDVPSKAKKALMVAGFFWSALRYRVHDLARPFVRPVDWVLRTRDRREGFVGIVVGAHVIFIVWHFGFFTLVTYGWTWTGGSGVFAWALLNWLGKRRGIELASDDDPAKKE
ncbi:hypothetical protein [Streptomyces sp. NPDC052192]|uniref:hypothetical protein n=1 Tax=Streptomyces sp. NPDC052192 TaxID=3155052 RepID=UPI00343E15CA